MTKKKTHNLVEIYTGEIVEVITRVSGSTREESEEGIQIADMPVMAIGYFVDADESFIHLSSNSNLETIDESIKIDDVVKIRRLNEEEMYDMLMDNIPAPGNKEDYN